MIKNLFKALPGLIWELITLNLNIFDMGFEVKITYNETMCFLL